MVNQRESRPEAIRVRLRLLQAGTSSSLGYASDRIFHGGENLSLRMRTTRVCFIHELSISQNTQSAEQCSEH